MEYPKFIVSNQKEESISIQKVKTEILVVSFVTWDINLIALED